MTAEKIVAPFPPAIALPPSRALGVPFGTVPRPAAATMPRAAKDRIGRIVPVITNKSTEQKKAEAEVESFREELGPFVLAAETTRMAMVFADAKAPGSPIIFANDSFLSLSGYERKEVLGERFNFPAGPSRRSRGRWRKSGSNSKAAPRARSEILFRRKDGSEFWTALVISPVRDAKGDRRSAFRLLPRSHQAKERASSIQDAHRRAESSREKYPFDGAVDPLAGIANDLRSQSDLGLRRVPAVCPLPVA